MKETGANLSARIAISILNQEKPGFFYATFNGGKRGRFGLVIDYQTRIPVANFDLNGGGKGLIYNYQSDLYDAEIWMALYGEDDYQRRSGSYSDFKNELDNNQHDPDLDLLDNK